MHALSKALAADNKAMAESPGFFALNLSGCYPSAMNRFLMLCLAALAVTGCKSRPFSVAVSPRLTGRVVAADTGQPIADVLVRNLDQPDSASGTVPPKGGQLLHGKTTVRTDRDGQFALEAERVLAPFGGTGWFSVRLAFEHAGYERFLTNYSYLNLGTNSANGQPGLNAGNILLRPSSK
jgi:hypothetical protein